MPLNQQQQNVAQADRALPLKVVAGAGTGKTETLAARFVEFVRQGVPPDMILLLTFTEEAAAEMRERVTRRLAEAEPDLPAYLTLDLWCHTFHGFAMRLLRQYGWLVRLPPTPRVLEDDEQQTMLDELVTSWEDTTLQLAEYQPFEHASYSWEDGAAWSKARAVLASLRSSGATPEELEPHPMLQLQQESRFGAHRAQLVPLIMHAFGAYSARLGQAGLLDHDELISAVGRLLDRMPELAGRFAVIMSTSSRILTGPSSICCAGCPMTGRV
jgi:DNA helicase-2/ATP-dependent DNA helicase PcrA